MYFRYIPYNILSMSQKIRIDILFNEIFQYFQIHCVDHKWWDYGPRRSQKETSWRENFRLLLLILIHVKNVLWCFILSNPSYFAITHFYLFYIWCINVELQCIDVYKWIILWIKATCFWNVNIIIEINCEITQNVIIISKKLK